MLRRITRSSGLLALTCLGLALAPVSTASGGASSGRQHAVTAQPPRGATPGIDPAYIYSQLDHLATRFQHREAGYGAGRARPPPPPPRPEREEEGVAPAARRASAPLPAPGPGRVRAGGHRAAR